RIGMGGCPGRGGLGEGGGAQQDGRGHQAARNGRRPKQRLRQGNEHEERKEKAAAAIGYERTGEYDRQHGAALAQPFGHEARDGGYATAVVHELAEQGAEQKQREELRQEDRRTAHEGLGPVGEQRLQRERGGKQRGGRSEKEHAPAAQREPYEQRQSEQDPNETHRVIRP